MSESEKETALDTSAESPQTLFDMTSMDDFWRLMTIARGGNPNAQQALEKFIDLDSAEERAYYPDKITSLAVAQNLLYGESLFPDRPNNAFAKFSECLSKGFMGYRGFKSNQWVDITRQTHNLDALKSSPEEVKQGFLARFVGGGKE